MLSLRKAVGGFISTALIFGLASVASAAPAADAKIDYAQKAPAIDGKLDAAWKKVKALQIKNFPAPTPGNDYTDAKDAKNLSASWRAMWDEKNLYVLVEVIDDKKVSKIAMPQGDGVSLYIDPDNSKDPGMGVNEAVWDYGYKAKTITGWTGNAWAKPDLKGVKIAQVDTAKGYTMEFSIPWANVLAEKVKKGKQIGIDVMVSDNDKGGNNREHKLSWHSKSDDAWEKEALLGTVELTGGKKK